MISTRDASSPTIGSAVDHTAATPEKVNQVAGFVNANGTPQKDPISYSVSLVGTTYKLVFPEAAFTDLPVPVVMTIGGGIVTGIESFRNTNGTWGADVTLSVSALFGFIATQISP